jgi:hypothetical protein
MKTFDTKLFEDMFKEWTSMKIFSGFERTPEDSKTHNSLIIT